MKFKFKLEIVWIDTATHRHHFPFYLGSTERERESVEKLAPQGKTFAVLLQTYSRETTRDEMREKTPHGIRNDTLLMLLVPVRWEMCFRTISLWGGQDQQSPLYDSSSRG